MKARRKIFAVRVYCMKGGREGDDVAAEPKAIPGETWVGEF